MCSTSISDIDDKTRLTTTIKSFNGTVNPLRLLRILHELRFTFLVFDVTLSVYPHRAGCKVSLTTVGIEPVTFGIY